MEQRFHILTSVQFRHTYFADNVYRGFTVKPDAETEHNFKRLSLIFKAVNGGFRIIYETTAAFERKREDILAEPLTFGFTVTNQDEDLVSYTEGLPANITNAVIYLRNNGFENGHMHSGEYVSENDILQNKLPDETNPENKLFFSKPFGWLELRLDKDLPETLYVSFKARETIWRYIVNSEHLDDLMQPAIIHKDTKEVFKGPLWVEFPDGKKRMTFESNRLMPLKSRPEKVFQLVENYNADSGKYKVVLSVLPNPNIKLISLITRNTENQNSFSEIFI